MLWQDEVRSLADFQAKFRRFPSTLAPLRIGETGRVLTFPRMTPRGTATLKLVERVID